MLEGSGESARKRARGRKREREKERVSSGVVIVRAGVRAHGTPWEPCADEDPGAGS